MAYSAITTAEVTAGKATKQEVGVKIKDNFTDHETRIVTLETSLTQFEPIVFEVKGAHYKSSAEDGVAYYHVPTAINITAVTLLIVDDGSSGTTTIDIQKSASGGASFATIFSSKPSVAQGSGDFTSDAGTLSGSLGNLSNDDELRLDVDAWQVGNFEFKVIIEYEVP